MIIFAKWVLFIEEVRFSCTFPIKSVFQISSGIDLPQTTQNKSTEDVSLAILIQ